MGEVRVSSEELKRVADEAEDIQETAETIEITSSTGGVADAMPGATAVGDVASAGTFIDSVAQSLADAFGSFTSAVRSADEDYNATDQTASLNFEDVASELEDY